MEDHLYPEMPDWFKFYLNELPAERKNELRRWINQDGSDCALDMMTESLAV